MGSRRWVGVRVATAAGFKPVWWGGGGQRVERTDGAMPWPPGDRTTTPWTESLDPCPKGWDYDPMLSHELGELAVETGIFPLYEVEDGVVRYYGKTKAIVEGRGRKSVRDYLLKQGRFAHFTEEDWRTSLLRSAAPPYAFVLPAVRPEM